MQITACTAFFILASIDSAWAAFLALSCSGLPSSVHHSLTSTNLTARRLGLTSSAGSPRSRPTEPSSTMKSRKLRSVAPLSSAALTKPTSKPEAQQAIYLTNFIASFFSFSSFSTFSSWLHTATPPLPPAATASSSTSTPRPPTDITPKTVILDSALKGQLGLTIDVASLKVHGVDKTFWLELDDNSTEHDELDEPAPPPSSAPGPSSSSSSPSLPQQQQ
ncbi:hypothetical protein CF328_g5736 [Tilletia controversa]|nr:hypothetical protein CF328_g5736 [Tilletia controversa]